MSDTAKQADDRTDGLADQRAGKAWTDMLIGVSLIVAMVLILLSLGRSVWCQCGQWTPVILSPASSHTSQHLLDPFSLTHFSHGLIFWLVLARFGRSLSFSRLLLIAAGLECLWEVVENTPLVIDRYRTATIALGYEGDTIANSLVDVIACVLGFLAAQRLGARYTLLVFAAIELFLLITIRDCLLLNVVMLIYPIDAIRQWQTSGAVAY